MSITTPAQRDADGDWPEGAYEAITADRAGGGFKPASEISERVMCETHQGLVLSLSEANGYDDSDFYAHVWNPQTGKAERILYASTRGWTYDCCAGVDATAEVRAAYNALVAYEQRRARVCHLRRVSKLRAALAQQFQVRPSAIRRLEAAYGRLNPVSVAAPATRYSAEMRGLSIAYGFSREPTQLDRVVQLAQSHVAGRLRSDFKMKLAQQVVDWLRDPAPRYATPLSAKQAQYV